MKFNEKNIADYLEEVPKGRQVYFNKLRDIIISSIPDGFEEQLSYGMIGYVVPHSIYPDGYHVSPLLPLPFVNIASQKNFIALYHMGLYANPTLLKWFELEYPKYSKYKLDMGKSCIRFKKIDQIPYDLIEKLMSKMSVKEWIILYEKHIKK